MKIAYNRRGDIFLIVLILIIPSILWAASDAGKDGKPSHDERYIIKRGDTLWDISSAFLKNPFLWPEIWKENRYILDPNLIYPGNSLNIHPPSKTELMAKTEEVEWREGPSISIESSGKDKTEAISPVEEIKKALEEERVLLEKVIEQMIPEHKLNIKRGLLSDYIISDGIEGGLIIGSKDNRNLLGKMDRVYIKAPTDEPPVVGESLTVIRRIKRVIHPKTGNPIGDLVRVLGIVKIVDLSENLVTAEIIKFEDYITKGDRLIPYKPSEDLPSDMSPDKTRLRGYIVESRDEKEAIGQFDIVYIDMGREDGVLSGDEFLIYKEADNRSYDLQPDNNVSTETPVGKLKILSTGGKTSTAEVTRSVDVIGKGYTIERVIK